MQLSPEGVPHLQQRRDVVVRIGRQPFDAFESPAAQSHRNLLDSGGVTTRQPIAMRPVAETREHAAPNISASMVACGVGRVSVASVNLHPHAIGAWPAAAAVRGSARRCVECATHWHRHFGRGLKAFAFRPSGLVDVGLAGATARCAQFRMRPFERVRPAIEGNAAE
jgi:hypothetical protein